MKFKVYKTKAALEIDTWDTTRKEDKIVRVNKAVMEIAPSNGSKGIPKPGDHKYDYTKKLKISFNPLDMLKIAYFLRLMSSPSGSKETYTKFGDPSKVSGAKDVKDGKKTLTVATSDSGEYVNFSLLQDKTSVSIGLSKDEAYALAIWFEETFKKFYHAPEAETEED